MSQESLKAALTESIENIKRNSSMGKVVFRAETRLEEDVRCTAKVRDFPAMVVDEPPELGGGNQAMNPVELLLSALGTCQEIMYAAYASVMDIQIDELKVNCKGNLDLHGLFALDDSIPAGYTSVRFETHIKSPENQEKIRALVEMAQGHCPLLDTITRAVHATGKAYLNGEEINRYDSAMSEQREAVA